MKKQLFAVLAATILLAGCQDGDERLVEKAKIEGAETARAELTTQLDNKEMLEEKAYMEGKAAARAELAEQLGSLARRSEEMESDLRVRHRFFQAVRGVYEGKLQTEQGEFKVRVTLVPSLPPYQSRRVRQLEEVASDLNNLYFNAQVVQWNGANPLSAVGCRVEQIRPDIVNGEITIASANCPNLYALALAEAEPSAVEVPTANASAGLALAVREGRVSSIQRISGSIQPTTNASVYQMTAERVR